jgi:hypothetical protein
MKYATIAEMAKVHYDEVIAFLPQYQDCVQFAFGQAITMMITAHAQDLVKVREDLQAITDQYLRNIDAMIADGFSRKKVLH